MSASSARTRAWRTALAAVTAIIIAGGSAAAASAAPSSAHGHSARATAASGPRRACAATIRSGIMSCFVLIRPGIRQRTQAPFGASAPSGYGYGPASLRNAYKLPSSTTGAGQTVAVVDAYNDPKAAADLAAYRRAWGEPACKTATGAGCLTVVNQNGKTSPLPKNSGSTGWATEESLDIEMVAAICPNCRILLVEASYPSTKDLGTGVNSAVRLGAKFVSNSYGGSEARSERSADQSYYNHKGVAVTASAGDSGYGVSYPAASPFVTAVGGTSLSKASTARGWTETVWGTVLGVQGTGSGCSKYEPKLSWQHDTGCGRRTVADVAAVADPNTGVAVYDTYDQSGWLEVGGTSASSPIIASVFALAGPPAAGTYPSSYPYAHTGRLYDVTSGSNGLCSPGYLCTAGKGYDGPTGWGTPHGTSAFAG